jgi:hypothetical protein
MRAVVSPTARLSLAAAALCAAGALFGAPTAAAATCPHGQMPLDGTCIPTSSPNDVNTDIGSTVPPPDSSAPGEAAPSLGQPGIAPNSPLPEVDNIPCTGGNSGQCIGLEEDQPPPLAIPHSSISNSP